MEAKGPLVEGFLERRSLSPSTAQGYGKAILSFIRFVDKSLVEATKDDLTEWYRKARKLYKPKTIVNYATCLRILYTYSLREKGHTKREAQYLGEELFDVIPISDLLRQSKKENALKEMIVYPDEFKTLLLTTDHPRVKAIIAMLRDSGCRKGEVMNLKLRDVRFHPDYVTILVHGKTGERNIPLFNSIPYLKQWLMVHLDRGNSEQFLFVKSWKGRVSKVSGKSLDERFRELCRKAELKRITPHMLRHTDASEKAGKGWTEFELRQRYGWTSTSRMPSRYVHLFGSSHVDKALKERGIIEEHGSGPELGLTLERCPNCDNEIGEDMTFCSFCGMPLDDRLRVGESEKLKELEAKVESLEEQQFPYERYVLRDDFEKLKQLLVLVIESRETLDDKEKDEMQYEVEILEHDIFGSPHPDW